MHNRQTFMHNRQSPANKEKGISIGHDRASIVRTLRDAGYQQTVTNFAEPNIDLALCGRFSFEDLPSGLRIHCTDNVEQTDGKVTSEIEVGISVNFLLNGNIKYGIGQKTYQFDANTHPIAFANVIGETQPFTRYLRKNSRVKKLNLSVEKNWLLSRCSDSDERNAVMELFNQQQAVYHWDCDENCLTMIAQLLQGIDNTSFETRLTVEQLAFRLMLHCYQHIQQQSEQSTAKTSQDVIAKSSDYESRIDALLSQQLTLKELADRLGASISTLQRYFKANHQVTLKEYVRNQKLELARRALIFERKSIGEASYIAGYNHVSNFATAFRKYFAVTPAELQKQYW